MPGLMCCGFLLLLVGGTFFLVLKLAFTKKRTPPPRARSRSSSREWEVVEDDDIITDLDDERSAPNQSIGNRIFGFVRMVVRAWLNFVGSVVFIMLFVGFMGGLPVFLDRESNDETMIDSMMRISTDNWFNPGVHPESKLMPNGNIGPDPGVEEKLQRLFPNDQEYRQILGWGHNLYVVSNWDSNKQPVNAISATFAWRRLLATPGANETDLFKMQEVVEKNIPLNISKDELLKWADQRRLEPSPPIHRPRVGVTPPESFYPEPPNLEWFKWWVIYEQWCPVESMFRARLNEIVKALKFPPDKFGRNIDDAILIWGADVVEQERELEQLYPPSGKNTSLLAAWDRLNGRHIRATSTPVLEKLAQSNPWALVGFYVLFPNDDVTALAFGGGWRMGERQLEPVNPFPQPGMPGMPPPPDFDERFEFMMIPGIIGILILGATIGRGMRFITIGVFAAILGIGKDPAKQAYSLAMRRRVPRYAGLIVVIVFSFFVTQWTIQPFFALYIKSDLRLFLIIVWTTILGGVLIGALRNIVTMLFIRMGVDPVKTIWDDVAASVLGGMMLILFQNSLVSVVASVAVGILPGIVYKWISRQKSRSER